MSEGTTPASSPRWSSTTKLVLGLTFVALVAAMLIFFRSFIGPLLLAFILVFLLHPLAARLSKALHLSWRASVNIIFVILLLVVLGLSTLTGLAVINQIQSLIDTITEFLKDLPELLKSLSGQVLRIGPFTFDLTQYSDISKVSNQLISLLQQYLGEAGSLVSKVAGGAANTVGWFVLILVISYFVLADAGQVPDVVHYIDMPGYAGDLRRMGRELGRIWNSFFRGQIVIMLMIVAIYTAMLAILNVRYFYALAFLAGLSRFLPYVGPWISGLITALVTFFQAGNYFHLEPWAYTLMVLVICIVVDQIIDNLVAPRIIGQSLGLHPAAVMVVALISARLIGLVGLVLAAPVLATGKLIGRYALRKMFDQDPWPEPEGHTKPFAIPRIGRLYNRLRLWWRKRKAIQKNKA
jgi:predicted PurR-regulated permease PerM